MNLHISRRRFLKEAALTVAVAASPSYSRPERAGQRPNIIWIVAEDASAHLGCYGHTTVKTANLDSLARQGVRFDAAFVTCPVCSPSRSAMITGMYQTTLGAHNHRSQAKHGKAGSNKDYYNSYKLPVKMIPEIFRRAGYYTTLSSGVKPGRLGKTDYNFVWEASAYDAGDWRKRPTDKPLFAQIMLKGGKNRGAVQHSTDPASVKLPPYYPDHPVLRKDWANYLNSIIQMDLEVGQILEGLKEVGIADNSIIFFWTDHGISHLRGKQFLYDEGARVPLIVRFPGNKHVGQVRDDLVLQIDVAATSLALAGIDVPDYIQGQDLFAKNYRRREMVFAARDRCDETIDIIRSVRTRRYKYIRNFLSHLPHAQPNQYKDRKEITKTMRTLYKEGKLNQLQSRVFKPTRPPEELYDLKADPHEIVNLAGQQKHAKTLLRLRKQLYSWMTRTGDLGLIPEPILEDLGRQYGNKYFILQQPQNKTLVADLIDVIEAGEQGYDGVLNKALDSKRPAIRYWAATGLGILGKPDAIDSLSKHVLDPSASVRIAAALALCKLTKKQRYIQTLLDEITNDNLIVGMYAIAAVEISGIDTPAVRKAVEKAKTGNYEFTRRIANRLSGKLK